MPRSIKDLTGLQFDRWRVVELRGQNERGAALFLCRCKCGNESVVRGGQLTTGKSRSCGCITREENSSRMKTHGKTRTPEFKAWQAMMQRCFNPKCKSFNDYGGRGIGVCAEWKPDPERFMSDMGPRPSRSHSIHRIDNEKGYSALNCKWATKQEQANARRSNVLISHAGKSLTIREWSDFVGIPMVVLHARIRGHHWTAERALTTSVRKWKR